MMQSLKTVNGLRIFFEEMGDMAFFAGRFFRELFSSPFEHKELLRQCYIVGVKSLFLVAVTGFILGLVFTLQSRPTLMKFGHLKRNLGAGAFLLRGIDGINAELGILGSCFNIARMITISGGVCQLMSILENVK
jgi:ABC-type transporter Mla maintaining outer membrane lipid asymmetry permease subunit MlaE